MTNCGHCSAWGNAARKLGFAGSERRPLGIVTETNMPSQNHGANPSSSVLWRPPDPDYIAVQLTQPDRANLLA